MKKLILILASVLVILYLAACGSNVSAEGLPTQTAPTTAPVEDVLFSDITLGMTPQQLLQTLEALNIALDMPDYAQSPIPEEVEDPVEDGRTYNMTDYSFFYSAKDLEVHFTFTPEGILQTISVWDDSIPTEKGLVVGDSPETMEKLYGTDYQKDVEDYSVFQYPAGNAYLNFFYEEAKITGWMLSIYPNIHND